MVFASSWHRSVLGHLRSILVFSRESPFVTLAQERMHRGLTETDTDRMHLHSISAYCGRPPSIKGPPWIPLPPPHPAQSALRFGSPPLFLPKELSFHDHHVEHSTVDSSRPFYSS